MRWYTWAGLIIIAAVGGAYFYAQQRLNTTLISPEIIEDLKVVAAAQNEEAFHRPTPQPAQYPDPSETKNLYWGDVHSHTNLSFDAYIFGNRLTLDQAYEMARGEAYTNPVGEVMQLSRPLDFVAITDHAEGFGLHEACAHHADKPALKEMCDRLQKPDVRFFLELRRQGEMRPPVSQLGALLGDQKLAHDLAKETWAKIAETADRYNDPGKFTAFASYEYSPPLPDNGKIHRNIIFRGSEVPDHAVSAFDALSEIDLWRQVSDSCEAPCQYLTIPHNPNKTWGLAFAGITIDGDAYTADDWMTRKRVEPLVEMFQIKGNSECAVGIGTTDEQCAFEQFFPVCEEGQETLCIKDTSMMRDGLKKGLKLQEELGVNPLAFGLVGSTDTHNSNPGDTEEYDFRGESAAQSAPAQSRLHSKLGKSRGQLKRNPGGLAAVWAPENTRAALFDAMMAKETYATSGTRIELRFFGSFNYDDALLAAEDQVAAAYAAGVPMGGMLMPSPQGAPAFWVMARQDPMDAPLDKVQVIKSWRENGETQEVIYDVACADGRLPDPDTHRCPLTTAKVDLSNCAFEEDKGAEALSTLWRDPDYAPTQNAFYYVRVIQNPTCRWSTYDALRIGEAPPEGLPATSTEMAWSSPIWITSTGHMD